MASNCRLWRLNFFFAAISEDLNYSIKIANMTSKTTFSVNLMSEIEGTVQGHRDGHGFLVTDDGESSVYLSPQEMRSVLHKDRVRIKVIRFDRKGRPEGQVLEILDRRKTPIIGRLLHEGAPSWSNRPMMGVLRRSRISSTCPSGRPLRSNRITLIRTRSLCNTDRISCGDRYTLDSPSSVTKKPCPSRCPCTVPSISLIKFTEKVVLLVMFAILML